MVAFSNGRAAILATKLTFSEVKHYFEQIRGFILLDDNYVNSETPMRYMCTCGKESSMSYKNAKKGRNCRDCGKAKLSEAKQVYTKEFVNNYYLEQGCVLLDVFVPASTDKLRYLCVCGNESSMSWYKFNAGHRCQSCRTAKATIARRKYTMADVSKLFTERGKTLLACGEFVNSSTPLKYKCSCGNESHITLNNFLRGKDCRYCGNAKISNAMMDPNITDEERITKRHYPEYKAWRIAVFTRDDYTCQCCGERGGVINAHHIRNYADNKDVRTDIDNGVTLCKQCHGNFHSIYGVRNTDADQLAEFMCEEAA